MVVNAVLVVDGSECCTGSLWLVGFVEKYDDVLLFWVAVDAASHHDIDKHHIKQTSTDNRVLAEQMEIHGQLLRDMTY